MPKIPRPTDPADRKAKKLLYSFLTERQKRSLRKNGWFEIVGSDGRTYDIGQVTKNTYPRTSFVRVRGEWLGEQYKCSCCRYPPQRDTILDARPILRRGRYNQARLSIYDEMLHQMLAL